VISSVRRDPLEGQGGHAQLAGFAGVAGVQQQGVGRAVGQAVGFSIVKTAVNNYKIGTVCSGLNAQFDDLIARVPAQTQQQHKVDRVEEREGRAMPEQHFDDIVAALDKGIRSI
jgi:hypothetical protein